ncbi:MAG: two-component sensor histidine kinase [Oscillibacter sp.]|nr:two-component sensor histidine kinase [Oscillibacter sp.]
MTSKILKSILTVVISILLITLIVITGVLYQYFGNVQQAQLKDELSLAANAVEQLGKDYLGSVESDRYRLTWVAGNGEVLFDSNADISAMENHADREEIREALTTGTGSSTRRSATLLEQTIYEAISLEDGSVLRISVSRATAIVLVLGMLQPIAFITLLAIAFSMLLAHRMAKRVVEPLNKLDLDKPMDNDAYEELSPLLHRIHAQRQEIKQQMRALKQKQDEFEQITGNMKEALVLLDAMGRIVSINPAARSLFSADTSCIGNDFLTIDRKQSMRQAVNTAKEDGQSAFRAAVNGREYQFDLSRIGSEDKLQGIVILAFDVTEQVNAERNRREFTANVSHELKTPLQSIIGSAELMENGIVKPEDTPAFVGRIRKEAIRLVTLIDDIIRLSQLDEGGEMPHEELSLRVLAEEVCETLSDAAGAKGITMEVSGDDGVINGVHRLLYEVIYNLCDNAIKYNVPGGRVTVCVAEEGDKIRLSVQDTGIGIAPEHQSKVFERFYRVDKSHSKQSGGTGLGLSIVKHAVQYHHGKIEIISETGTGTYISVEFPR